MKGFTTLFLASLVGLQSVFAAPASVIVDNEKRATQVSVTVPAGSLIGSSYLGVESFSGIPFAQAPVGSLRLKPPVRLTSSLNNFDGTKPAPACPQFISDTDSNGFLDQVMNTISPLISTVLAVSEDCLSITVARPAGTKAGDKLPVLFWIFGGGFELGWSSMYDGTYLVKNAIDFGKPYVFVAVNYRVGAFGFMPGKEILADGAANLGLLDQRMGLQWVADNIAAFGGDPDKVTLWGESAGAISIMDQMALYDGDNTYKGKPLFRGAIMNSGSIVPADPVDCPKGQAVYDEVVSKTSCKGAADTLNCLRALPYNEFLNAANSVPGILSYSSVALSYLPRPDGKVLTASPDILVKNKKYAAVPMIIGDQEDEGTLFSLFQSNTTATTPKLVDYLSTVFFHNASPSVIKGLVDTYSFILTEGSPFRTGLLNEIYPGFKRLAALLGDAVFTLSRRIFLTTALTVNPSVPAWSYIASYDYGTPILGTFHGSDLLQVFFGILPNYASRGIQSYYANFVYNLNPNDYSGGTSTRSKVNDNWPQWTIKDKKLKQFYSMYFTDMTDNFRQSSADYLAKNMDALHI